MWLVFPNAAIIASMNILLPEICGKCSGYSHGYLIDREMLAKRGSENSGQGLLWSYKK